MQEQIKDERLPFSYATSDQARLGRITYLESIGHKLDTYYESTVETGSVKSNIEAFMGTMAIPVGLVGPLKVDFEGKGEEQIFAPVATTEGALVASMNRGVGVLNKAAFLNAHVTRSLMQRAPIFSFENLIQAREFSTWVKSQKEKLNQYIKNYSKHATLLELNISILGKDVEVKFDYETGDAAGQNMTTICTWQSCLWIERKFNGQSPFEITEFILEGNGASDKKLSYDSTINGRGTEVIVEALIPENVLNRRLKVKSSDVLKWYNKSRSIINKNGMLGDNINVANAIAALFTACGQDIACVHESAVGFLNFETHPQGLYVTLKLPKLVIGTVGGGTNLPSQRQNLNLMGCYGVGKKERLAKLIGFFTLGLELSTISAMVSGQFALAHERLGRNKPVQYLSSLEELITIVREEFGGDADTYIDFKDQYYDSNGIITEITAQNTEKKLGLSLFEIKSSEKQILTLLKSKPLGLETLNCMYMLSGMIDPQLAKVFNKYKDHSDFQHTHLKEQKVYEQLKSSKHIPQFIGSYTNDKREIYFILMEYLSKVDYPLMNSENKSHMWSEKIYKTICFNHIKDLFKLKSLNKDAVFEGAAAEDIEFSRSSLAVLRDEYGSRFQEFFELFERSLSFMTENSKNDYFQTLIHNDFNPRNIAATSKGDHKAYDWELARVGLPQRDFIELLAFILDGPIEVSSLKLLEEMRIEFNKQFNLNLNAEEWLEGAKWALSEFTVKRVNLYLLGHKLTHYDFVNKLVRNIIRIAGEIGL